MPSTTFRFESDETRKMNIKEATRSYEAALGAETPLIETDLALKHQRMAEDVFPFLRATFYRWAQLWPEICPELARAPQVTAVGDLHVENFGTWRDIEGRLVWGVNDLDEVAPLAYANDLVRLAASALMAIDANHLALGAGDACQSILSGYAECLEAGGRPFILAEEHKGLRAMALGELRDPIRFWAKMDGLTTIRTPMPDSARSGIEALMPEPRLSYRVVHRVAGLGSLGRQRFVALADWHGAKIAREAKALVPSACVWACGGKGPKTILYQNVLDHAVRCVDPFVRLHENWIVRRLAPDCSRIELASLPEERDEIRLLHAMGWETANIHLSDPEAVKAVRADLKKQKESWLRDAAKDMVKATKRDWEDWKG